MSNRDSGYGILVLLRKGAKTMFCKENGKPFKLIGIKPIKTKTGHDMTFVKLHDHETFQQYEMVVSDQTPVYDPSRNSFLIPVGADVDLRLEPNDYQGKVSFRAHLTPIPLGK